MDLIVAGTDEAILMVEAGADGVTEAEILDALDIAHGEIKKLCRAMEELAAEGRQGEGRGRGPADRRGPAGGDPRLPRRQARRGDPDPGQARAPGRHRGGQGGGARAVRPGRRRRRGRLGRKAEVTTAFASDREGHHPQARSRSTRSVPTVAPRTRSGRSSARSTSPRACTARRSSPAARRRSSPTSPSARRGWTCGSTRSAWQTTKRFWHHYNFPPFSVGEAGFMRGPKRRDIGHGALAERALVADDPGRRGLPLRDPGRLGDARVQRLLLDGLRLRLLDGPAGGRAFRSALRSPASPWA